MNFGKNHAPVYSLFIWLLSIFLYFVYDLFLPHGKRDADYYRGLRLPIVTTLLFSFFSSMCVFACGVQCAISLAFVLLFSSVGFKIILTFRKFLDLLTAPIHSFRFVWEWTDKCYAFQMLHFISFISSYRFSNFIYYFAFLFHYRKSGWFMWLLMEIFTIHSCRMVSSFI